jgi:hypothetical protein
MKARSTQHRVKKRPLKLTNAQIAEIGELIEAKHQQDEQERRWHVEEHKLREERNRRLLAREDPAGGAWPERLGAGSTEFDGYVYVREGDKAHEVPNGHPFLVEMARRDGMIRYAWRTPAPDVIDLNNYWAKRDPSLHFVMSRVQGIHVDDWDRALTQAIDELLDTDIPLSRYTKEYIKYHRQVDTKRRKIDLDRSLAFVMVAEMKWLEDLLRDAGFADAKTRAEEYLARHWRKIVRQDRGRWRFSSGPALSAWLRRHDPTKSPPKMSSAREPSKRSSER